VYSVGNLFAPLGLGSGGFAPIPGAGNDSGGFGSPGLDSLVSTACGSLATSAQMSFVAASASQSDASLFALINPTLAAADQALNQAIAAFNPAGQGGSVEPSPAPSGGAVAWLAPPAVSGFGGGAILQHGPDVHPTPMACGSHFG
jgi:hypothetical protein